MRWGSRARKANAAGSLETVVRFVAADATRGRTLRQRRVYPSTRDMHIVRDVTGQ